MTSKGSICTVYLFLVPLFSIFLLNIFLEWMNSLRYFFLIFENTIFHNCEYASDCLQSKSIIYVHPWSCITVLHVNAVTTVCCSIQAYTCFYAVHKFSAVDYYWSVLGNQIRVCLQSLSISSLNNFLLFD